jgi:hypothetical protein
LKIQILLKSDKKIPGTLSKGILCFMANINTDIIMVAFVIDASMVSAVTGNVLFTRGQRGYMYVPVPEAFFLR